LPPPGRQESSNTMAINTKAVKKSLGRIKRMLTRLEFNL
jgi:hypothetical protein